jgi:hypothetical protein
MVDARRYVPYVSECRRDLNDLMQVDHVVLVREDGTVADAPSSIYAPDIYVGHTGNGKEYVLVQAHQNDWSVEYGWSRQYNYAGPVMHPSEFIGGDVADHIMETPGLWAAVVPHDMDADDLSDGWVLCFKESD